MWAERKALQHRICTERVPLSAQCWSSQRFWSLWNLSGLFLKRNVLFLILPGAQGGVSLDGEDCKIRSCCTAHASSASFFFLTWGHMDSEEHCHGLYGVLYVLDWAQRFEFFLSLKV